MKTNNNSRFLCLDYIAVAIIVIAFFVISYCGFFNREDISMNYGVSTIFDVLKHTKNWYFKFGGRLFSVASQYMFSGVLGDNKIWFDIVNTMFFVLLIMTCGKLINNRDGVFYVLLFALLFWFLCPVPRETLFWVAGSTTYLWANTLSFVFLLFFQKYKDSNFGVLEKIGLCIISVLAASEFITGASISGALAVYYAFNIKKLKGNAIPLVAGFALGSIVLLFAPGNFLRAGWDSESASILDIRHLLHHPGQEILKYKALWLFMVVLVWGWIKNKMVVKEWMKDNAFLLLSLGWSVIACSVVFRPIKRALFFTETLSIILFLRFLYDNLGILRIRFVDKLPRCTLYTVRNVVMVLLFAVFVVDSVFAAFETNKQRKNNDVALNEIVESGGFVVLDRMISSHRMAYNVGFPKWTWEPLAAKFSLDSVHVYPYYCQDKYYILAPPMDNIYIDEINYKNDNDVFGKYIRLIVRIKNEELQASNNRVTFTIDYTRPKKWYKLWLDKLRNYQYDRTVFIEKDYPDVCFEGYCYYFFWLKRENAKNLKSVKYKIE